IQNQQSLVEQGGRLFNPTCGSAYCHGANGAGGSAPPLRGRNFTDEYLTRVISEGVPRTPMPAFKNQHSPEQIRQIVAYVMSLPKGGAAPAASANNTALPEAAAAARAARRPGPEDQATTGLPMPAMKDVTGERLANAAKEPQNWMTYFGSYDAQRYSALNQINRGNVKQTAPLLAFQTRKNQGRLNA